jgi:hypothetical protein
MSLTDKPRASSRYRISRRSVHETCAPVQLPEVVSTSRVVGAFPHGINWDMQLHAGRSHMMRKSQGAVPKGSQYSGCSQEYLEVLLTPCQTEPR